MSAVDRILQRLNILGKEFAVFKTALLQAGGPATAIPDLATNLSNSATGTEIATAVNDNATAINGILAALRANGVISP